MKEKIPIKLKNNLPRGQMPPPSKLYVDKKKEENKNKCRNKQINDEDINERNSFNSKSVCIS